MFKKYKQTLIEILGLLIVFTLGLFFLYCLEAKQFKSMAILGFLLSFFYSFLYPWIGRRGWTYGNSKNPNRASYSDLVFRRRFKPFTTSKKGRMISIWLGGFSVLIVLMITFFYVLEIDKKPEKDTVILVGFLLFMGLFLGWGFGLLRDYIAYKKLPKGTIYPDN